MEAGDRGEAVILVRPETTPDDVLGMQASRGILTARGGMVSHAAVVARGWGIPAVVGAGEMHIDGDAVRIGATVLDAGDEITIDGSTGHVYLGRARHSGADAPAELDTLLAWADAVAAGTVQVRANADTEGDASQGRILGAQGIGLCRTEHMFLAADRLPIMRRFILADTPEAEEAALDRARGGTDRRLRDGARGDGRSAGHGPPARPTAARVPARPARADRPRGARRARRRRAGRARPPCVACARPTR